MQRAAQLVCVLWFCRMLEGTAPAPVPSGAAEYAADPGAFRESLAAVEQRVGERDAVDARKIGAPPIVRVLGHCMSPDPFARRRCCIGFHGSPLVLLLNTELLIGK